MAGKTSLALKQNKEKVLKAWEVRALKEVPSASTAESLALRNSLPMYLDHLSEALASDRKMDVTAVLVHDTEAIRIGKLHGADRAGTANYVLTEVIFEYHILREVLFEVLEADGQLSVTERNIILDSIEQAVNDAAVKFSQVHADIQQKFVATLTHDLKTPLTGAKLSAQLVLKRSDRPDDCIKLAGRIIGNLNRLDSMIHDLLDVSKLRAGEPLSLQLVDCDFSSIVRDVVDDMSDIYGRRFELHCKDAFEGAWSDDGLRRMVENLLSNAAKYSSPSTPILVFLTRDGSAAKLVVHNQGPSIPEDELPLLFQQYRRAKNALQSSKTGWGLGLALVKGVVEAHHGTIGVESAEGKGTTFTVQLPIQTALSTTSP